MAAVYGTTYEIGYYVNGASGTQTLESLGLPNPSFQSPGRGPRQARFIEFASQRIALSGDFVELGFPSAVWYFINLSAQQFQTLHNYVGDNPSSDVYITTFINYGGTSQGSWVFQKFQAKMRRPTASQEPHKRRTSVVVEFSFLVDP